jgi:tRNA pseudouridine38-40 synthase
LSDRAYFYPYKLNIVLLNEAASIIKEVKNFESFSKRNTQVKSFICLIQESEWVSGQDTIVYRVTANRFLRGMVKGLVGTMLKVGTGKTSLDQFVQIIESHEPSLADFSVPPQGLRLVHVAY